MPPRPGLPQSGLQGNDKSGVGYGRIYPISIFIDCQALLQLGYGSHLSITKCFFCDTVIPSNPE